MRGFLADLRREFSGYNGKRFSQDLMAGITVAAVALPLALAFGVSSGADAAAGLITAILGGIVIGFLSGASYQISGPTGAMAAVLAGVVASYGLQGVFVATLLAGIVLVLAGGWTTSSAPTPPTRATWAWCKPTWSRASTPTCRPWSSACLWCCL